MQSLWGTQVSDGAVSRVIGILRKSLNDNRETPEYIETVAKKGYRLIATVQDCTLPTNPWPLRVGLFLVLLLLILLFTAIGSKLFLAQQPNAELASDALSFTPLTSETGFESDPALSYDGRWLLYSHRVGPTQSNQLYLKQLDTSQISRLTESVQDNSVPKFSPDARQIAFFRKGEEQCNLMILTLDATGHATGERSVYRCGAYDHYSNVVWSKDGLSLYFTDRADATVPYQIHHLFLATGRVKKITLSPGSYYGDNELALSPDGLQLAFYRNKYWGNNEIYILDLETMQERKVVELGFLAMRLSWTPDNKHLLYSDNREGGKIKRINVNTAMIDTIFRSSNAIRSPQWTTQGQGIIYVNRTAQVDLWRVDLTEDISVSALRRVETSSSRDDWHPQLGLSDDYVFMSNRGGAVELWHHRDTRLQVLNSLTRDQSINSYSWFEDSEQLVLATKEQQLLHWRVNEKTATLLPMGRMSAAYPSVSGNQIYFTSDVSGDWQVWQYQIDTETTSLVTQFGGYQAKAGTDGAYLYFTKYQQNGLWRFELESKKEEKFLSGIQRNSDFFVCADKIVFLRQDRLTRQIWRVSINGKQEQMLLSFPAQSQLRFSVDPACKQLMLSKRDNIQSDIMLLGISEIDR
jgi:Tol biopolymer transport system component